MDNVSQKKSVLNKLSDKSPKILEGIDSILNDSLVFNSLNRAITALVNAKNEFNLTAVEAALQVTINDIKSLNDAKSPYMDDKKTSLYLYTLQNLIYCLSDWTFENGNENNYVPVIAQKFNQLIIKAKQFNLDVEKIKNDCFTDKYRDPDDPYLNYFGFLDEDLINDAMNKMQQYEMTGDEMIWLPEKISKTELIGLIDKVMDIIKNQHGDKSISLPYIKDNLDEVFNIVGSTMQLDNRMAIAKVVEVIVHRVLSLNKEITHTNENQGPEMGM